jgi:hypothetical protein
LLTHLGSDVREQVPALLARTKAPLLLEFAEDGMTIELG